jgi:hypothetical protein
MLRESGFVQVEVTGRSGDGSIDGKDIMRLNGLVSLHVIFEKRATGWLNVPHCPDASARARPGKRLSRISVRPSRGTAYQKRR